MLSIDSPEPVCYFRLLFGINQTIFEGKFAPSRSARPLNPFHGNEESLNVARMPLKHVKKI